VLLILLPTMVVARGQVELTIFCGRFPMEVELCREAAEAWADQTGNRVQVLSATGRPERRLELYEELLGIGTERLDVLESAARER
jgi:trehalose/maltose transport system substrate-binding protein